MGQDEMNISTYKSTAFTNRELLIPYFAPYIAYVGIAALSKNHIPPEWSYAARILIVSALLIWNWGKYVPLTGPKSSIISVMAGIVTGLLGVILWILLLKPFVESNGGHWSDASFGIRLISAGLLVPVFEELLMRGYLLRLAFQWDTARKNGVDDPFGFAFYKQSINRVEAGAWTVPAVLISTLIFALGHEIYEWPAAVVYGILMSALWITRKDLISCIIAHGVTNISLAIFVRTTGQWALW